MYTPVPLGMVRPENIAAGGASAPFTKVLAIGMAVTLRADVDIWYRIGAAAAVNGGTSAKLRAGTTAVLVYDGVNSSINVIADSVAGRAWIEELVRGA